MFRIPLCRWSMQRRRRKVAIVLACGLMASLAGERVAQAFLGFDPIIFDPRSYAENTLKLSHLIHQVQQAEQVVTNSLRMAANWGYSQRAAIEQAIQRIEQVLGQSDIYTTHPVEDLNTRYPTDYGITPARDQFDEQVIVWNEVEREALIENRTLQNEVIQNILPATVRIEGLVNASNSAEGETAAAQAHTELLAETSVELTKLQALKLSRARLKVERQAREQSDAAYREGRRQWLMRDWSNLTASASVAMPFGQ